MLSNGKFTKEEKLSGFLLAETTKLYQGKPCAQIFGSPKFLYLEKKLILCCLLSFVGRETKMAVRLHESLHQLQVLTLSYNDHN